MSILARHAAQEFGGRFDGMPNVGPGPFASRLSSPFTWRANPITMAPQFNSSASLCSVDVDEIALRERKEI